jgi:hypothetical protein
MPETIEKSYRISKDAMKNGVTETTFWPDTDLEGL